MIGDPYATVADLETRLGKLDDGTFASLVDVASRTVEAFTRRQFNKTETASARRFRAVDWQRLPVDDFHTVTDLAIVVDSTAWDVADVDPRPWDGIVDGQPGWPFFDLFAVSRSWPVLPRRAKVTVTAQWGWAAVPEGIMQSTLDVAAAMSYGSGGSGPVRSESIDGYSVTYQIPQFGATAENIPSELVKAVPYRRRKFGVA